MKFGLDNEFNVAATADLGMGTLRGQIARYAHLDGSITRQFQNVGVDF